MAIHLGDRASAFHSDVAPKRIFAGDEFVPPDFLEALERASSSILRLFFSQRPVQLAEIFVYRNAQQQDEKLISTPPSTEKRVSVVITSKDRVDLLISAIRSVVEQSVSCEIIVVDDGSTDKTAELVPKLFPDVIFVRNESAWGIIEARNQAFALASCEIIFTLDDDAVFGSEDTVERVLECFVDPIVGIVAIPLIDHVDGRASAPRLPIRTKQDDFLVACDFSGGANAIRRDLFHQVGGYIGNGRQSEERGVTLRLLDQGFLVRVAHSVHIDHYPQPGTSKRVIYYMSRNSVVFGAHLIPFPAVLVHFAATTVNHLRLGWARGETLDSIRGLIDGCIDSVSSLRSRRPVRSSTFRLYRRLLRSKTVRLSEIPRSFFRSPAEAA